MSKDRSAEGMGEVKDSPVGLYVPDILSED